MIWLVCFKILGNLSDLGCKIVSIRFSEEFSEFGKRVANLQIHIWLFFLKKSVIVIGSIYPGRLWSFSRKTFILISVYWKKLNNYVLERMETLEVVSTEMYSVLLIC